MPEEKDVKPFAIIVIAGLAASLPAIAKDAPATGGRKACAGTGDKGGVVGPGGTGWQRHDFPPGENGRIR
ncbi:MAG: hypothetical protein LJE68_07485 [Rhodobacter sp.]|nr:hypothetical protein [Rhodobacter sp.]